MLTTLSRIIKYGFQSFWRNGWLSMATLSIIVLALVVFEGLIIFSTLTNTALNSVQEKIDISMVVAKKIGTGKDTVHRSIQIYKRGTEEQKERVRTGESSINKVYKELEPIRHASRK